MKLVHIKLEVVAQVNDEELDTFTDPANGEVAVESLLHEWNHGEATLTCKPVRREPEDVATVDWTHR